MNIIKTPEHKKEIKRVISNDSLGIFSSFIDNLENSNFDLDIFYLKIKTLKYQSISKRDMSGKNNLSEYNIKRNILRYDPKYLKYTKTHELFHIASTLRGKTKIFCGFSQIDIKTGFGIGVGLTEGYTCILDERYSSVDESDEKKYITTSSYPLTKIITSMLEDLITKEVMEELYSKADLYNLVNYLSSLTNYQDTIMFVKCVDLITKYCDSLRKPNILITLYAYKYA